MNDKSVHKDLSKLEDVLGHSFANKDTLRTAVTHSSHLDVINGKCDSYQRFEFLGDRVLGLVVADMVFGTFPDADEGELSRRLTQLVRKETCADIAEKIGLGDYVRMGQGEAQSGGRRKKAILGDSCEAVIAAIFLDAGYAAAELFIKKHWHETMHQSDKPLRDAKTALQEWAHASGLDAPTYTLKQRSGPDHKPVFEMAVIVSGEEVGLGTGASKRIAEQNAARDVLTARGVWTKE